MQPKQPQSWPIIVGGILLLAAAWMGYSATLPSGAQSSAIAAPQEGFMAPDFTLHTNSGDFITLSELRGQAVLVNIWTSWCGPCKAEMPAIEQIYQEYADQGFVVLAVNSTVQDNLTDAVEFVERLGLTFPILFDPDGTVTDLYQIRALPTSFFIDPEGIIQEVVIGGPMAEALLRTRIQKLLGMAP